MSLRQRLGLILCAFAVCGFAVVTQRLMETRRKSSTPADLYTVVWKQIAAMREADYAAAYRQVSNRFQERVNAEAFIDLVRSDYPVVVRSERVEFGAVTFEERHAFLQVYFFLPDGETIPCLYSLIYENGGWKIDAARIQKRRPAGQALRGVRA